MIGGVRKRVLGDPGRCNFTFLKLADLADVTQCWLSEGSQILRSPENTPGSSTLTSPRLCFKSFAKVPKVEHTLLNTHEHRQGTYKLDKHPHPNKIWHMTCICDYDMKHDMTQTKKRRVSPPLGDFYNGKSVWNAPKNVRLRTAIEILMVKAPDVRWKFVSGFYSKLNVWRILTRDWDTKNHKDFFVSVKTFMCVRKCDYVFICTTQKNDSLFANLFGHVSMVNLESWFLIKDQSWVVNCWYPGNSETWRHTSISFQAGRFFAKTVILVDLESFGSENHPSGRC